MLMKMFIQYLYAMAEGASKILPEEFKQQLADKRYSDSKVAFARSASDKEKTEMAKPGKEEDFKRKFMAEYFAWLDDNPKSRGKRPSVLAVMRGEERDIKIAEQNKPKPAIEIPQGDDEFVELQDDEKKVAFSVSHNMIKKSDKDQYELFQKPKDKDSKPKPVTLHTFQPVRSFSESTLAITVDSTVADIKISALQSALTKLAGVPTSDAQTELTGTDYLIKRKKKTSSTKA